MKYILKFLDNGGLELLCILALALGMILEGGK